MGTEVISKNIFNKENIFGASELIGKRVLSSNGQIIGKIREVVISKNSLSIEGIIIKRRFFSFRKIFIGEEYFRNVSDKAIILSIEPSTLLKGRKVINEDGRFIGRIKDIIRKGNSNDVDYFVVKKMIGKSNSIKFEQIKFVGKSLIKKNER